MFRNAGIVIQAVILFCCAGLVAEEQIGGEEGPLGVYVQTAMDNIGNIHMVYVQRDWNYVFYMRYTRSTASWSVPQVLYNSNYCHYPFGYPDIAVGPDGLAQIVYGKNTGEYPYDLAYFYYAKQTPADTFVTQQIGNYDARRGYLDIAVDDSNQPHIVYEKTNINPSSPWWEIIYRRPDGAEIVLQHTSNQSFLCHNPCIAYNSIDGNLHIAWYAGGTASGTNDIWWAAGPPGGDESDFFPSQLTHTSYGYPTYPPDISVEPDGQVQIVFLGSDWLSNPPRHTGVYMVRPGWTNAVLIDGETAQIDITWPETEDYVPNVAFDNNGTRYVSWSYYMNQDSYYKIDGNTRQVLSPYGNIDVCGGNGAYYVRAAVGYSDWGPLYYHEIDPGGSNTPPSISVLTPPSDNDEADASYTISWTDTDPDDNATISLYYDTNSWGYDGTLISGAGNIQEDPDGFGDQFNWDISNHPDDAVYWVYGIIDDGTNPPATDYAPGWLRVNHVNDVPWIEITAPMDADTAIGTYYTIGWNDADPDDNAQISLYYSPADSPTDSTLIVQGLNENSQTDEYSWDLSALEPGTYRIYATITDGESTTGDHSDGTVTSLLVLTYDPTDDTSVFRDWEPGLPHGDLPEVEWGADDTGAPDGMAFFKFQISDLQYGVIKAFLTLYCINDGGGGGVHSVTSTSWTEEDLTWNNMPGIGLVPIDTEGWFNPGNWYSYDVTPLISGNGTFAMALRSTEPNAAHVASKENSNATIRPYLELHVGGDPPLLPPTAQIVSISPDPVIQGYHTEVTFIGTAWDNDEGGESIDLWRWHSDLDGIIGSTQNLVLDPFSLTADIHEISFRVRDDEGDWSPFAIDDLEVRPPDTTGPTWPSGIGIQALVNIGTGGKLEASWNAASDANPPVTYNLYYNTTSPAFDGTQIEDVSWIAGQDYDCNYLLTGLTNGQPYYVGIRAVDLVGNEDENVVELVATPADITPPNFASGPSAVDIASTSARIVWTTNEPATSIVGYWITPEESLSVEDLTLVTSHSVQLVGLTPGIVYFYRAYSSDAAGNDATSDVESFQTASGSVYSYLPTDDAYVVSWQPDENFGSVTRLIVETNEVSYLRFDVLNREDVAGARLQVYCAETGDSAAVWHVTDTEWDEATLVWNNRPEIDGPHVGGIRTPTEGQVYSIDVSSVITGSGSWAFAMTGPARDICQFYSKEHTAEAERPYLVVEFAGDTEAPTQVTGVTCSAAGSNDLYIDWSPSTDNVGVAGYRVYRATEPFFDLFPLDIIVTLQDTEYTDVGILGNPNVEHYYVITAYDMAGNESERSATVGESEFDLGGDS